MIICPTCRRTHADETRFCPHDGTPLQAGDASLVGQTLDGRYEIEALISETRNGQLYRARDARLGRHFAVEMFRPGLRGEIDGWREHDRDGWDAALSFRHPNAVSVYEMRPDYIVTDYIEGQTLDRELREHGRFVPLKVYEMLEPVASALDAAHAHGIICDFLTPSDIMI
ncbi:MAG TPA: hypothetical protein VGA87_01935, partial [Pyrinomonadaceae bacterium]